MQEGQGEGVQLGAGFEEEVEDLGFLGGGGGGEGGYGGEVGHGGRLSRVGLVLGVGLTCLFGLEMGSHVLWRTFRQLGLFPFQCSFFGRDVVPARKR